MLFIAWVYQQVFHCCRRVEKFLFKDEEDETVPLSNLPWLWLGFLDDEGTTIDYTNTVKFLNIPNIHVTSEYLNNVTDLCVPGKWQYMNPTTLQVEDFPSDGFVINHVVDEPATDKKTD